MEQAKVPYYFPPRKGTSSFCSLFILFAYLLSKSHYGDKYSKTTKVSDLKFGQMISLYMKLCASNFGDAASRGFKQMRCKLVTTKFIK